MIMMIIKIMIVKNNDNYHDYDNNVDDNDDDCRGILK